jgi:hypothetical protein
MASHPIIMVGTELTPEERSRMKAEHRKELQTNVLADRMGRFVQGFKERPKKRVFLFVLLGLVIVVGLLIFMRIRRTEALERSKQWSWLEDGYQPEIRQLIKEFPETNAGKGARFQLAWIWLWDDGLKMLAYYPVQVLKLSGEVDKEPGNLEIAESVFLRLRKDCENDSIWEPEALYGLAVIEETKAIRRKDRNKHLTEAQRMYKKLADKYGNSSRGKLAKQRAEALEKQAQQIAEFYEDLNNRLDIEKAFGDAKKKKQ